MNYTYLIYALLALINLLAFLSVGFDKKRSIENGDRVREVNLFLWAIFFGSVGVLLGMLFYRHKTQKLSFIFGISILLVQHLYFVYAYIISK